jgi:TusA-related sulfurtransferase
VSSGETHVVYDCDLNVVGTSCPLPLIKLATAVRGLRAGQTVRITGNDPIFEDSVLEFCRERGHQVLDASRDGRVVSIAFRV